MTRPLSTYRASELSDVGLRELLRGADEEGFARGVNAANVRRREQHVDGPAVFRFDASCLPDGAVITVVQAIFGTTPRVFVLSKGQWTDVRS